VVLTLGIHNDLRHRTAVRIRGGGQERFYTQSIMSSVCLFCLLLLLLLPMGHSKQCDANFSSMLVHDGFDVDADSTGTFVEDSLHQGRRSVSGLFIL
jgi:hypothetical protein